MCIPSNMANLLISTDPNFIPPMGGVVQSESIQDNRVVSKNLNFSDLNRKDICH